MCAFAMTKEYLTIDEIADMLGVNRYTVQGWIARKELPAYKLGQGRAYRIAPADLEIFLQSRRTVQEKGPEAKEEE